MKRLIILIIFLFTSLTFAQESAAIILRDTPLPPADSVRFELVLNNLSRPVYVTHAGDGSQRLFIVEQRGRIYVYNGSELTIFMDISGRVSPEASGILYTERGLLGLAFHPNYAENGLFFVNYTDLNGNTVIARYQVSPDNPNLANIMSAKTIFQIEQPYPNHNGGYIVFGDDGYLYVGLGDGGDAGDPLGSGQNPHTLLGTILRLVVDVENGSYAIPVDNPFVNSTNGALEIWSYGLRNPWRFSFDRATGDMYIADVGQNQWEEINFEPVDSMGGLNYGWNALEATHPYSGQEPISDVVMPIAEYDHSLGISVTGGYVYRGQAIPDLQGVYLFSDFGQGRIWYAYRDMNEAWQSGQWFTTNYNVSSFGEDETGELYLVNYRGSILKLVPNE
jgi:glucose/arabinose dehydrogenase